MSRQSSVIIRAGSDRPAPRRKANGGDGGRERDCNDTRTIFQLRCKSLRQIPLHDVAVAYKSCGRLSGPERQACFVAHDLCGDMVDKYYPTVQRLENAFAPPVNAGYWHLDRARDVLLQLLPQCDALTPTQDPDDIA